MRDPDDRFANLNQADQRRYMAQAIGCDPDAPAGWPDRIIDNLVHVRLTKGTRAYYIELGTLLGRS